MGSHLIEPPNARTSALMRKVRQRNTRPEMEVRSLIHGLGFRYRVNDRGLPGSPDIANRSKAWAVFVHGCFWHGHLGCRLARLPKSNLQFWEEKILDNRNRDLRKNTALKELGFKILTVWQCELKDISQLEFKLKEFIASGL